MTFIATMKTLTITSARQNLGAWLARAARGEEIGIISGAQVIALRPVAIAAADYAEQEYRLTKAELAKAAEKIHEEIDAAETIEFTGDLRAVLLTKRFLSLAEKLEPAEIEAVNGALRALPEQWGNPYADSGYSLRRLAPGLYEIRAGLGLRVVFDAASGLLRGDFVGNHDDVQTYLRNRA